MTEKLNSFQDLGSAMRKVEKAGSKSFTRKPIDTCKPDNLRKLVEIMGTATSVGEKIGISGSHIGNCLKEDETRVSYDLAAKAVIMEMEREKARPNFYLVEVPSAQREFLDTFLTNMKMKWTMV